MIVTCLELDSDVVLSTERQKRISFKKGETLLIMSSDEDTDSNYYVCSAGGNIPFVWVDKRSSHKVVQMELSEWQKSKQDKKWHRFSLPLAMT